MKTFLAFILTQICRWPAKALRTIVKYLDKIPVVDILVYFLAEAIYFVLDKPMVLINSCIAISKGNGEYRRYKMSNSIMIDKKLNVSSQYLLNATLIKGDVEPHFKFGNEFSTVSDQMGRLPKMTTFGYWCKDVMLDTIEDEHCAKAVELNNNALLKRVNELNLLKYQDN